MLYCHHIANIIYLVSNELLRTAERKIKEVSRTWLSTSIRQINLRRLTSRHFGVTRCRWRITKFPWHSLQNLDLFTVVKTGLIADYFLLLYNRRYALQRYRIDHQYIEMLKYLYKEATILECTRPEHKVDILTARCITGKCYTLKLFTTALEHAMTYVSETRPLTIGLIKWTRFEDYARYLFAW